jgi:hypothetical protein
MRRRIATTQETKSITMRPADKARARLCVEFTELLSCKHAARISMG